ncbi:hypothetical protein [Streptomyces sp. NPDC021622]|uniref:hypothetical protein n=1 Tax=Streptomyces sp. NPDC021622 TaxID=3155013 RepID=UPI0034072616
MARRRHVPACVPLITAPAALGSGLTLLALAAAALCAWLPLPLPLPLLVPGPLALALTAIDVRAVRPEGARGTARPATTDPRTNTALPAERLVTADRRRGVAVGSASGSS